MPYVSDIGRLEIIEDVSRKIFNPQTREYEDFVGEFDKKLVLTSRGGYSYNIKLDNHVQHVFEGDPEPDMLCFKGAHLWRIMTQKFVIKDEDGMIVGHDDESWWRFYRHYRPVLTGEKARKVKNYVAPLKYVCSYDDFQVQEYGSKAWFHFPVWILELMKSDGVFETYKGETKLGSDLPYVTDQQIDEMMYILDQRKKKEATTDEALSYVEQFKEWKRKEAKAKSNRTRKIRDAQKKFQRDMHDNQAEVEDKITKTREAEIRAEVEAKIRAEYEQDGEAPTKIPMSDPLVIEEIDNVTDDEVENIELTDHDKELMAKMFPESEIAEEVKEKEKEKKAAASKKKTATASKKTTRPRAAAASKAK